MSRPLQKLPQQPLITEDDEPVDNIFSEKQQKLLTSPLYKNWDSKGRSFFALANVGIFDSRLTTPLVPDVMLSMDVVLTKANWPDEHRSYMMNEFIKPPDVVIEIVSNTIGKEKTKKKKDYLTIGVPYYVIFDPLNKLSKEILTIYHIQGDKYQPYIGYILAGVDLGLKLWVGEFEGEQAQWLRWVDHQNQLIPTGDEQAEIERTAKLAEQQRANQEREAKIAAQQRADQERTRADQERTRADQESARAELLAAKLRKLGIDPETL